MGTHGLETDAEAGIANNSAQPENQPISQPSVVRSVQDALEITSLLGCGFTCGGMPRAIENKFEMHLCSIAR